MNKILKRGTGSCFAITANVYIKDTEGFSTYAMTVKLFEVGNTALGNKFANVPFSDAKLDSVIQDELIATAKEYAIVSNEVLKDYDLDVSVIFNH